MVERLEKIARESDPAENVFLNLQRAELFRKKLSGNLGPQQKVDAQIQMSLEYLFAGETETAIQELSATGPLLQTLPSPGRLAHLRLGEQQNCVAQHTSYSCLLPIGREGVHTVQEGSRDAIRYFTRALTQHPQDLESIWLLNVAFMTLGEYPDNVPPQWRIPPGVFDSEYDIHRFKDVAPESGLAVFGRAGGAIMEDFDNDGFLDIVRSAWGLRDQLRFFRNNGDGSFTERTKEACLEGIVGGLNLIQADYNNDGYRDILVLRGAWLHGAGAIPNSLLRNNGDGTFSDVTEQAGLLSFHPTQAAGWADYDGDGYLDLFIGNESDERHQHPCELYHNNGDGTFTECAAACGVALVGFVKGVAWGDYDNDGRPDLYLSRFGEANVLFRNAGPASRDATGKAPPWKFQDVTAAAGVAEPRDSFPCWFWDYNNDGWLDLFVAPYSAEASMEKVVAGYLGIPNPGETPRLYRNNGNGTFTDVTKAAHLDRVLVVMGANFGDLDNDGWLDLYVGTGDPMLSSLMPNRMFRNNGGLFFQDVTTAGGFGHVQKGHGVAFGDIDNDGDQDVYEVLGGAYEGDGFQSVLFENPGHGNHWITLRLRGTRSNRDAIGARFELQVLQESEVRKIYGTVSSGGSFGGSSLQQEIGLGSADSIQKITIQWPLFGQHSQIVSNLPMDRVVEINQGEPGFHSKDQKRFALGGAVRRSAGP
ncbi:MAG: hypothetical protein DME25_19125 [Verrucomicrobia bacterium]|nr:MAG: hypothetical protein DME25_19125 [Verrucomicrobiota bacterium]